MAMWWFVELRIETYEVIGSRTRVAENNLSALLTDFAVILMIALKNMHVLVHYAPTTSNKLT